MTTQLVLDALEQAIWTRQRADLAGEERWNPSWHTATGPSRADSTGRALDGLVTHTLRKTVVSFLDDAHISTRKISDQLGHARVSMTQDRYLGRRLTDRETAEALER